MKAFVLVLLVFCASLALGSIAKQDDDDDCKNLIMSDDITNLD